MNGRVVHDVAFLNRPLHSIFQNFRKRKSTQGRQMIVIARGMASQRLAVNCQQTAGEQLVNGQQTAREWL